MYFIAGQRRRLNYVATLVALFVPWLLYCAVFWLLTFWVHYKNPQLCYVLIIALFIVIVGYSGYCAAKALKNRFTEPHYQPSWYVFIAVTAFVAFIAALVHGDSNYQHNLRPYYDLTNLEEYVDVDTNVFVGQQLMDAGRIKFKSGTGLRIARSMGFKNHDTYCVAPIITLDPDTAGQPLPSVDFWAVGKNCCSGVAADFHCSGFSDPQATGVIRMMLDEDRSMYRMAVQQAEATYKMTSNHPLFFQWVHDADEATNDYANRGWYNYWLGIASFFVLQIFLVAVSALAFSKLV